MEGILNDVAVVDAVGVDTNPAEQTAYNWDGSVDDGSSYFDRFKTSQVRTWNPQTKQIEMQEVPTWKRAARGLSTGLKNYGLTLLKSGGDDGKAWAAGIESAFGDLDSEISADNSAKAHQARVDELIKSAKYTPGSIADYARTGNPETLTLEKELLSAKERADVGFKVEEQKLDERKQTETERKNLEDEKVARQNAGTAAYNAQTSRFSAENSWKEVEGTDGNKYIQPINLRTGEKGEMVLKDSAAGKELIKKGNEQQAALNAANDTLVLIDEMLKDDKGRESAVGALDARAPTTGESASNYEANHRTLTSKMFLDSVKQMKGMGALSDAEGRKLEAAIAGLELSMNQNAYKRQLQKVKEHYVKLIEANEKEKLGGKVPSTSGAPAKSEYSNLYM